jgi:hypothetical protein
MVKNLQLVALITLLLYGHPKEKDCLNILTMTKFNAYLSTLFFRIWQVAHLQTLGFGKQINKM